MAKLHIGDSARQFSLPGVDGKTHAYAEARGSRATVVIFTCNHCPYARAWEDRFVAIQNDYRDQGVNLIAINANDAEKYPDDNFEAMRERAQERGFTFPYLRDESQEIARAYGAERTPEVFVFDSDDVLRYHGTVDDNHEDPDAIRIPYLRSALDSILNKRRINILETTPVGCTIKWKPASVQAT
ncbi:MAG TPA: thioredoxin family protein [Chloroflexota bacterium]|nr:thioredoxin family protein [Chloroflexota bacterium]